MDDAKGKRTPRVAAPVEAPAATVEAAPAAAPVAPALPRPARSTETNSAFASDPLTALAESQRAVARGWEAIGIEMAQLMRSRAAAAASTANAMLGAKTFADAIEINAGFARQSFDALIGSSATLSEIAVRVATDVTRPLLSRLSTGWTATEKTAGTAA